MSSLQEVNSHTLNIENRIHIFMTGALNVENFDDTSMKIETVMGDLELKGSGIHITKFDTEAKELAIEGEFDSVEYTDNETPKGGFLSRLFG